MHSIWRTREHRGIVIREVCGEDKRSFKSYGSHIKEDLPVNVAVLERHRVLGSVKNAEFLSNLKKLFLLLWPLILLPFHFAKPWALGRWFITAVQAWELDLGFPSTQVENQAFSLPVLRGGSRGCGLASQWAPGSVRTLSQKVRCGVPEEDLGPPQTCHGLVCAHEHIHSHNIVHP